MMEVLLGFVVLGNASRASDADGGGGGEEEEAS